MDIRPEFTKKDIRSFVIRAGRITGGQKLAFKQYWSAYGLSLKQGLINPAEVFNRQAELIVEVGFGMGDSLIEMARAGSDKNFIGIEVHSPGVGRLINQAGLLELSNIKVYMADATDVLEACIPNNSLDRFQLYFPDPWHKTRHHKRRIVQPAFVELIAKKLKAGGILHFATDWQNYAQSMLKILSANEALENCNCEGGFSPKPDYRPATKFERRGESLGHGVWDILFYKCR